MSFLSRDGVLGVSLSRPTRNDFNSSPARGVNFFGWLFQLVLVGAAAVVLAGSSPAGWIFWVPLGGAFLFLGGVTRGAPPGVTAWWVSLGGLDRQGAG